MIKQELMEDEAFKTWLRMEIAKQVSEADVRHLVFTSFDNDRVASVKNAIIRHIFSEWEIRND
jgi:hypothetical protein